MSTSWSSGTCSINGTISATTHQVSCWYSCTESTFYCPFQYQPSLHGQLTREFSFSERWRYAELEIRFQGLFFIRTCGNEHELLH
ncbi:hypothetical protein AAHA92_24204 [Salvia divinorum]|uniref:Uncharacterized protein n=1 Tax=Salvia divinorum TaxID=28513 RepID=A0ABD1G6N9_SALDI